MQPPGILEQGAKKCTPVFRKNIARTKEPGVDCDSTESQSTLERRRQPAPSSAQAREKSATAPREGAGYRDQPAFEYESFAVFARRVGEPDARLRLGEFIGQARLLLDELRAGSARGDLPALRARSEALGDASGLLGLARLAAISRELERVAARPGFDRIEPLRHAASAALHDAQPFIDEVLATTCP